MNYLAHAFLSFDDAEVLTGNLISDFVKGKKRYDFPPGIQRGIQLHRDIDEFTDAHAEVKKAREYFRAHYRLYSGAFIDVVFDHFLALQLHHNTDLKQLTVSYYQKLDEHTRHFPAVFLHMYPHMKTHNWLYNYHRLPAIERSFGGLMRRAVYITEISTAFALFNTHYDALKKHFEIFWPELEQFAGERFKLLHKIDLAGSGIG
jgi:acyl carrier protein phosphodiesterase